MEIRSCRVAICDRDGVDHTVHVTASTLYEAVALGLASIRGEDWVGAIPEGLNTVRVTVTSIPVEHSVKIHDFKAWLDRGGGSPRERSERYRIREILGVNGSAAK
jgi:hypothetical protein